MDQRAGVWPVEGSSSSGPGVLEDVEDSEPSNKLVAPIATTATYREGHMAQWACSVQNLVLRVLHRTLPTASASCRRERDHDSGDCH